MASTATQFDTDCVLMLHMDGTNLGTTFTDSSSSNKTITVNGGAVTSTLASKFGGSSALFVAATASYITAADSSDWDLGTADFTIDFWININTGPGSAYPFSHGSAPMLGARFAGGKLDFYINGSVGVGKETTTTFSTLTWYHVAATRSGTTFRLFVNGTQESTETNSVNITGATTTFSLGGFNDGSNLYDGYIDEFRVVKGTAVWTSNFTPPSAAYTPVSAGQNTTNFFQFFMK